MIVVIGIGRELEAEAVGTPETVGGADLKVRSADIVAANAIEMSYTAAETVRPIVAMTNTTTAEIHENPEIEDMLATI